MPSTLIIIFLFFLSLKKIKFLINLLLHNIPFNNCNAKWGVIENEKRKNVAKDFFIITKLMLLFRVDFFPSVKCENIFIVTIIIILETCQSAIEVCILLFLMIILLFFSSLSSSGKLLKGDKKGWWKNALKSIYLSIWSILKEWFMSFLYLLEYYLIWLFFLFLSLPSFSSKLSLLHK